MDLNQDERSQLLVEQQNELDSYHIYSQLSLMRARSLPVTLLIGVVIILAFNYYVSTARDLVFKRLFTEMAAISLGVSAFSLIVGFL